MDYSDNLRHSFSDIMNLTREEQAALNEIADLCNQEYYEFTLPSFKTKKDINFNNEKQIAFEYFKFGMNLIIGGLTPAALDILMENTYEKILEGFNNKGVLRLQLLFVKKAIGLLHVGKISDYIGLFTQITSDSEERYRYQHVFKELFKIDS
ncbi:MAG: hypothetical protein FWC70_11915 [Defluviitaleaceae bacterium]|nr:hypothetical protein [Defluviitaleaceae bacterium]